MAKHTDKILQEAYFATLDGLWYGACHGQISADNKNCKICDSEKHHAFDCPENPVVLWIHRGN